LYFFFNLIGSDLVKLVEQTVRSENCHSPNRPIYLVGESLGACLALAVAVRNPDIDLSLILANPGTLRIENYTQSLTDIVPTYECLDVIVDFSVKSKNRSKYLNGKHVYLSSELPNSVTDFSMVHLIIQRFGTTALIF